MRHGGTIPSFPSPLAGEGGDAPCAASGEGRARLRHFARAMRHAPTEAERALWRALRDRRFAGFKFRRQVPIGPFIADFVCFSHQLIIELDGSQHADNPRDARRDAFLTDQGYRILRVWNNDLSLRRPAVMQAVFDALQVSNAPSPVAARHPLPQGEREESEAPAPSAQANKDMAS